MARRLAWTVGPGVGMVLLALVLGPIHQPEGLHNYHDTRALLGLPNVLNVVSNLPFLVIGVLGLAWIRSGQATLPARLVRCYAVMFLGIALTAGGSAYYHWSPDDGTLLWDRIPMVLAFMGLMAGFLTERLGLDDRKSAGLLSGLVAFGIGSVLYWSLSGDMGVYALTQVYPILAIPVLMALTRPPYSLGAYWLIAVLLYVVAKALEVGDEMVFEAGHIASGHTLKHLVAAAGGWCVLHMLMRRRPLGDSGTDVGQDSAATSTATHQ